MNRARGLLALRLLALVGLAASAMLLVDYLAPQPVFCADGGGCAAVRRSAWSHPAGIPMPIFGVAYFAAVLGLSLAPGRLRRLLAPAALAGAAGAIGLVVVQAVAIKAFCKFCIVADGAGLAIGALGVALRRPAPKEHPAGRAWLGWGLAAVAVVAAPFAIRGLPERPEAPGVNVTAPAAIPEVVTREQRPGVATIVEFMDFGCSHCRQLHPILKEVMREYGDKVRLVRKHHPIRGDYAARAACCAEEAGQGEAMADALFRAEDLSPKTCDEIAARLGLDMKEFRACVGATRTAERLRDDEAAFKAAKLPGVPIYWIGTEQHLGAKPAHELRASIDRALAANP